MILNEDQIAIRKEFRTFLTLKEGKKGRMLEYIISASDIHIQKILKKWYGINISCIYDNTLSIEDLVRYSMGINSNEEILASTYGYISAQAIEAYSHYYADKNGYDLSIIIEFQTKSKIDNKQFSEGEEKEIYGIVYERDHNARKACIENYGCKCFICGMDFEQVYGELGKGFIEVHHIIPISERGGQYLVNPLNDLRPLCSNCHSMIHRTKNTQTIEELKQRIKDMTQK